MGELLRTEKETIFNYNEGESFASVYTCNESNKSKLKKLSLKYPNEVEIINEDNLSLTANIPKKWIKIVPPRALSEEQRKAASERMKKNRYKKEAN